MLDVTPVKERLGFLDVARGVAALLVLVFHGLGLWCPGYTPWALAHFNIGQIGVVLFLLVSGFIIPVSLEQGGSNARFWLRRFFRLFPLYWLSIALGFAAERARVYSPGFEGPGGWLLNLTMLQGFFNQAPVWGVFWTLQLELVIYATCSILYAAGLLKRAAGIAGLVFAAYAVMGVARPALTGSPFGLYGPRFLYLAPIVGLVAQRYWSGQLGRGRFVALLMVHFLGVPAVWLVNHAVMAERMTVACLCEWAVSWGSACGCFFLLLVARDRTMPTAACWLGRVSYSIYLLHPLVLILLPGRGWPWWAGLPALVGATLLLSEGTYRFVEAPGIALGRALEQRWLPARRRGPLPAVVRRAA
jgi:peptidoglycan/LPS O-acetylase OafA/YrhL